MSNDIFLRLLLNSKNCPGLKGPGKGGLGSQDNGKSIVTYLSASQYSIKPINLAFYIKPRDWWDVLVACHFSTERSDKAASEHPKCSSSAAPLFLAIVGLAVHLQNKIMVTVVIFNGEKQPRRRLQLSPPLPNTIRKPADSTTRHLNCFPPVWPLLAPGCTLVCSGVATPRSPTGRWPWDDQSKINPLAHGSFL